MCVPAILAGLGIGGGAAAGAATAAGATAAAGATFGAGLQTLGALIGIGGSIAQGIGAMNAARDQASALEDQRRTEATLAATEDARRRARFMTQIRQQRAELAARGVAPDSPTAILLGQTAARELSFESQAVRSGAAARDAELSYEARAARARGAQGMLSGVTSAAGIALSAAPAIWPGLADRRLGTLRGGAA